MKRWLVGLLLVVLAGVLLVIVINDNRDPIAVLEEFGAKIERNEQGEVVEVSLRLSKKSTFAGRTMHRHQSTKITDAGLVHLKGLTKLQTLNLFACDKITDAGIAELKKALPKCSVNK
ncbi:MAG: hypothetical protein MK004_04515 [Planctomycetales bacterium]|nr:hypothetical protein [Planctomycetales bacterium]